MLIKMHRKVKKREPSETGIVTERVRTETVKERKNYSK